PHRPARPSFPTRRSSDLLRTVDAVVASPMFGLNDELEGVLYGLRQSRGRGPGNKISQFEAQLVQLLAAAVGTNLARGEATRTRTDRKSTRLNSSHVKISY